MSLKKPHENETLGSRLQKRREALGLSIKDVADEIQTAQKHVLALEEDNYGVFPAKVYATGFLKKILKLLGNEDVETWLTEFNTEWEVRMFRKEKTVVALPENRGEEPFLTPGRLGLITGGVLLLFFLLFLSSQLVNFVGTPGLSINQPEDQTILTHPLVRVRGKTEKESRLTVNGRELRIDGEGNFDEEIELATGLNALEFLVENRFGKKNKEVRYIIVR